MRSARRVVRRGPLAIAITLVAGLAACASTQRASSSASDEDRATAQAACASTPAGAEHDRCIEVELRRARGARNTY